MRQRVLTTLLAAGFACVAGTAAAQQLQIPDLSRLNTGAIDVVDVTVDQALLGMAASFMGSGGGPDEAQVKSLISSLKGIYVKSFTYDKDGAYDPTALDGVRKQLSTGQWQRIVAAKSQKDRSDVAVYLWRTGDKPGGLAVLSAGPREVTLVNIVGMIDLEQLRSLSGKFGVPDIDLGDAAKPSPKPAPRPKQD